MSKKHFYNPVTGIPIDMAKEKGYQIIQEDDNKINNPRL